MEPTRCFFIGHRDAPSDLLPFIQKLVEQHILSFGVTEFIVGHYGAFDQLAATAVKDAKSTYPHIKLIYLVPYHPSERPFILPAGFDESLYPPGMESIPRRAAIVRANRYVIDHADYLIAYAWHPASNARILLEYAQHREKQKKLHISLVEPLSAI